MATILSRSGTLALLLMALAWPWITVPSALALPRQSESELRQQNERLQQRVKQLEAELEAALNRMRALEAAAQPASEPAPGRVPLPQDATQGATGAGTDAPTPASVDPALAAPPGNPYQSSKSILDAIRARFAADFAGKPAPRDGVTDERLGRLWLTEVERWSNAMNRELRRPIVWTVRVLKAEQSGRAWRLEVICVDPATGNDLGRPFPLQLLQPQSGPYELSLKTGTSGGDFTLRGVYVPQLALNPMRYESGLFDNPPFIGTFVEYGSRIALTSLVPVEAQRSNRPAAGGTAPTGTGTGAPAAPPTTAPPAPTAPPVSAPSGGASPPTDPSKPSVRNDSIRMHHETAGGHGPPALERRSA